MFIFLTSLPGHCTWRVTNCPHPGALWFGEGAGWHPILPSRAIAAQRGSARSEGRLPGLAGRASRGTSPTFCVSLLGLLPRPRHVVIVPSIRWLLLLCSCPSTVISLPCEAPPPGSVPPASCPQRPCQRLRLSVAQCETDGCGHAWPSYQAAPPRRHLSSGGRSLITIHPAPTLTDWESVFLTVSSFIPHPVKHQVGFTFILFYFIFFKSIRSH